MTTPSDKDNSYNNDYQERLATKTKRDDHRIEEDEDLEYHPVSKKKKVTNQKFISQTQQNDWNSDEYVEAKNETKSLFTENQLTSKSTKKAPTSNGKQPTKKVAASRDRKVASKPNASSNAKRPSPKAANKRSNDRRAFEISEEDSF